MAVKITKKTKQEVISFRAEASMMEKIRSITEKYKIKQADLLRSAIIDKLDEFDRAEKEGDGFTIVVQ